MKGQKKKSELAFFTTGRIAIRIASGFYYCPPPPLLSERHFCTIFYIPQYFFTFLSFVASVFSFPKKIPTMTHFPSFLQNKAPPLFLFVLVIASSASLAATPPPLPASPLFPPNTNIPLSLTDAPPLAIPLPSLVDPVDPPFDRPTLPEPDESFRDLKTFRHQIDLVLPMEFNFFRLPLLIQWLQSVTRLIAGYEADAQGTVSGLFDYVEAQQFAWEVRGKMELEGLGLRLQQESDSTSATTTTSGGTSATSAETDYTYAQSRSSSRLAVGVESSLSAGLDGQFVNYAASGCYKFGFQTMCTIAILPRLHPSTSEYLAPLPRSRTAFRNLLLKNPNAFRLAYLQGSNETDILCDALAAVLETSALGTSEVQRVTSTGLRVGTANISDLLALQMPFAEPTTTATMRDRDVFFALTEESKEFDAIATRNAQSRSVRLYDAIRRVGISGARCVKPAAVEPPSTNVGVNILWILFIALGCFSAVLTVFLLVRSNVDPPTLQSRAAREAEEEAERLAHQEERRSARRRARSQAGSDTTSMQRGATSVELADKRLLRHDAKKLPTETQEELERQRAELVEKNTAAYLVELRKEMEKREFEASIHRPMTREEKAMITGGSTIYGATRKPDKRSLRNMALDVTSNSSQTTVLKSPKDKYGRIQQPFYGHRDPLGMYEEDTEESYVQPMKIMLEHDRMFQLPPTEEELQATRKQVAQRLSAAVDRAVSPGSDESAALENLSFLNNSSFRKMLQRDSSFSRVRSNSLAATTSPPKDTPLSPPTSHMAFDLQTAAVVEVVGEDSDDDEDVQKKKGPTASPGIAAFPSTPSSLSRSRQQLGKKVSFARNYPSDAPSSSLSPTLQQRQGEPTTTEPRDPLEATLPLVDPSRTDNNNCSVPPPPPLSLPASQTNFASATAAKSRKEKIMKLLRDEEEAEMGDFTSGL